MQSRNFTFFIYLNVIAIVVTTLFFVNLSYAEQHAKHDTHNTEKISTLNVLYQINGIRIVFPFCKSTENRHVSAPSFCFRRTIDTFSQPLLQVHRAL